MNNICRPTVGFNCVSAIIAIISGIIAGALTYMCLITCTVIAWLLALGISLAALFIFIIIAYVSCSRKDCRCAKSICCNIGNILIGIFGSFAVSVFALLFAIPSIGVLSILVGLATFFVILLITAILFTIAQLLSCGD